MELGVVSKHIDKHGPLFQLGIDVFVAPAHMRHRFVKGIDKLGRESTAKARVGLEWREKTRVQMIAVVSDPTLIRAHAWNNLAPSDIEVMSTASRIATTSKHNDWLANVHTKVVSQGSRVRFVRDEGAAAMIATAPNWWHVESCCRELNVAVSAIDRKARHFDGPIFKSAFPADLQESNEFGC